MECPVDNQPMIILELDQVEIDFCTKCDGIWLDSGELELLMETDEEREFLNSLFRQIADHKEKSFKCPICSKKMVKVGVGKNKEVVVDSCPQHHGLWFDKGELEKVILIGSGGKENRIIRLLKQMFKNKLSAKE